MYEQPIHPANLWLERDPAGHAEVDDVYRSNIARLIERGTFTAPATEFPGARFIRAPGDQDVDWNTIRRELWDEDA